MTEEEIVTNALREAKEASKKANEKKPIGDHDLYEITVEAMNSIKVHAQKSGFPKDLFKKSNPNSEDEEIAYIEKNYQQVTRSIFIDFVNTMSRAFGDGNWSIEYRDEEDIYTKSNKGFKKYVEEELPIYKSLEYFIKTICVNNKLIDANGFFAVRPEEIDYKMLDDGTEIVDDMQLYRPTIFYFDSSMVINYDSGEYYLFLSKEKSKVKVAGKLEEKGNIFELYTKAGIYIIRQVGDYSKFLFEWELFYQNKHNEIPVKQLEGVPTIIGDKIFWESQFSYAVDLLNLVLINSNWLQAITKKVAFPVAVMLGSKCEFRDTEGNLCQDGYFDFGMPTQRTCSSCRGSGLKNRLGPLRTFLLNPTTSTTQGEENISQPPLQYVSPSVDTLDFMMKKIESDESKARSILKLRNRNSQVSTSKEITATEVYDDTKALTAMVNPFSYQVFTIYEWALRNIGYQRYPATFKEPSLTYPKTPDFKTPEDYIFDISEAIKNDLPPAVIQRLLEGYIGSYYGDSSKSTAIFKVVIAADRLFGLSQDEINMKMSKGTINKWEDILHSSVLSFVNDFIMKDEKWVDKKMEDKIAELQTIAKAKETEISSSATNAIYNV